MNEEIANKIENEILGETIERVKNLPSKEAERIIEEEVRKRDYLPEEWNVHYAVKRIKEKIDQVCPKKQNMVLGDYAIGFILGTSFAWSVGLRGFIPYAIGTFFSVWLKRKMLNSKNIFVRISFWVIFIIVILVGLIVRDFGQNYR